MSVKFKIVVPTYNTEQWIERCLDSILNQNYKNFECVVINDASTDSTGVVIDNWLAKVNDSRFRVIHNEVNKKALYNIINGFNIMNSKADPESVLMAIDGDDFLSGSDSFTIVNRAYEKFDVLLTYGNHIHHPTGGKSNCEAFPYEVIKDRSFRKFPRFVSSHLRTFKSKLWYAIKDEDLRNTNGMYYTVAWDVAFMMPMLEMAGERHIFIPTVLYCYNRINPISDDVIHAYEQGSVEKEIRSKPAYPLL